MAKKHQYHLTIRWTGNKGDGTTHYRAYERSHSILAAGKTEILASSDPAFRGDATKYNPEELLVASLAGCHMLWYLHLCAEADIVVIAYEDRATGIMQETDDGGGYFEEVTLYPHVHISNMEKLEQAQALHDQANRRCFIANSVKFPVKHKVRIEVVS